MDSIDEVFSQEGLTNSNTGERMTADRLFMDWTITNFLNDPSVLDGRYAYHLYNEAPYFSTTETIADCVSGNQVRTVSQYGTDYIQIQCRGNFSLAFSGSPVVHILPVSPINGTHFVWSNKSDVSDMMMTQLFDFTNVSDDIEMDFSMWYDLETDYDYVYLLSSSDGEVWKMVNSPSCTTENITGNNFGCGYNDVSDGWVQESVDLSEFAGQKIWLRFEYITDTAVTGEGFAVDSISIPQIDYFSDFESDDGGCDLQGFSRIENQIPQTFLVSLIQTVNNEPNITQYEIGAGDKLSVEISNSSKDNGVILVVSGSTRYTRQKANYQFEIFQ